LISGRVSEEGALVRHVAFICGTSLLLSAIVLAQAQGLADAPTSASEAAVHSYGRDAKDCLAWTDGCVNCIRQQSGADFNCSSIGIACQPKAIACANHAAEPAK
jgi:hypothetical protein